jgi:hypothetical protein
MAKGLAARFDAAGSSEAGSVQMLVNQPFHL